MACYTKQQGGEKKIVNCIGGNVRKANIISYEVIIHK